MKSNRNHEGYHDPTAYGAIRRVSGGEKDRGKDYHLQHRISETRGFMDAKNITEMR